MWGGLCVTLENIYVKKEFRNRGLGVALWKAVVEVTIETN